MAGENHLVPTKVHAREIRFARYRLTVIEGPDLGRSIEGSEAEVSIGTSAGNTLVLSDPTVSRHHVAIAPSARGHLVRDLDSTNGTQVNGVEIERAYLASNAMVTVGDTRLKFEVLGSDERAALSSEPRWGRALGASPAMRRLFEVLPRIAESE